MVSNVRQLDAGRIVHLDGAIGMLLISFSNVVLRCLKAELKRVTEERDILKKAAAYFAKEFR